MRCIVLLYYFVYNNYKGRSLKGYLCDKKLQYINKNDNLYNFIAMVNHSHVIKLILECMINVYIF